MKIKKYIYGFVISLCMGITACSEGVENMPRPMNVPEGFHAVSVPFHLPTGKPMYSEEGGSRGTFKDGTWAVNDELLMQLTATGSNSKTYTLYLKLKCTATGTTPETWEVVTGDSYVEYNTTIKNYVDLPLLTSSTGLVLTGDTKNLELLVDETMTVTGMQMQLMYAPDMEWDNSVSLKTKANPSTEAPEYWVTETNNSTLTWKATTQARLRIYTGVSNDKVNLKIRKDIYKSRSYTYSNFTATTDALGNAYFYGTTEAEMTDDFEVTLTHTAGTALGTPVLLLKASSVNPIHLVKENAYVFDARSIRNSIQ